MLFLKLKWKDFLTLTEHFINMKIHNFWKRITAIIDPLIGQTIIAFTTHGCMGSIHEFDYIGTIVDTTYPRLCDGKKFYRVKVLKDRRGELRDGNLQDEFREVASWYLQDLGGNFYIVYN